MVKCFCGADRMRLIENGNLLQQHTSYLLHNLPSKIQLRQLNVLVYYLFVEGGNVHVLNVKCGMSLVYFSGSLKRIYLHLSLRCPLYKTDGGPI